MAMFVHWRERFDRANPHAEHAIGAALVDFNTRLVQINRVKWANGHTGAAKITFIVDDADHKFAGLTMNRFAR